MIGTKTSSVLNIVVYGTWFVYVNRKIPNTSFLTGEKVPGTHLLQPSYTQVTLTDCSHQPEEEGSCDALHSSLHTTEGFLHFPYLTTHKNNCADCRNGITEFSGFETMTFPKVYLETGYRPMPIWQVTLVKLASADSP